MIAKFSKIITTCLLLISSFGFAQQDFQGKAHYYAKTDIDMSRFENQNFSEEQKKRIKDRMTKMFQKKYTMVFNQTESIYKIEEKLEAPGQGGGRGRDFRAMMSGAIDGDYYKNVQSKTKLKDAELFGKKFLISDSLVNFQWKMTGETKNIGQYTCFKATAKRTIKDMPTPGPPKKGEKPKKDNNLNIVDKEIEVVAWYTMQIPISQGPEDYWGLPGLILEIKADKTTILCSKIVLNPDEKVTIKKPKKGKKVSENEYIEISTKKFMEMREQFRKRRGQNSGNRNRR